MAYAEKYYHTYCEDKTGAPCRLSILEEGFTGTAQFIEAGPSPFTKGLVGEDSDLLGGVFPTMAKVQVLIGKNVTMDDFYTDEDISFKVEHYINGIIDWEGFMSAEGLSEIESNSLSILEINCFDGLTLLKDLPFLDANGENYGASSDVGMTFIELFGTILAKTGLSLELATLVDRVPAGTTPSEFEAYTVNLQEDGWVEGPSLNSQAFSGLTIGNYVSYRLPGQTGSRISQVVGVDTSQIPTSTYAQFSPPLVQETAGLLRFEAAFFGAAFDPTKDALAISEVSTRLWVNSEGRVNKSSDEEEVEKEDDVAYYLRPENAMMCWDILEQSARAWDVRIFQHRGRWYAESLDAHRLSDQYFLYGADGTFIRREARIAEVTLPACADEVFYREDGNTRYFQNAFKKVSVHYLYKFRTKHDRITNKILNNQFMAPSGIVDPATFVPTDWTRSNGGVSYNVGRAYPQYIEIWASGVGAGTGLNINTYIKSNGMYAQKGDMVKLDLRHSFSEDIYSFGNPKNNGTFGIYRVELVTSAGDLYYLVNAGDATPGWEDQVFQSSKLKARWEKGTPKRPLHLMINHSTQHSSSGWSAMSDVEIVSDGAPGSGTVSLYILGARNRSFNVVEETPQVPGFVPVTKEWTEDDVDRTVQYTENNIEAISSPVIWPNSDSNLTPGRLRVAHVAMGLIASSRSPGRVYEYEQARNVKESMNAVEIPFGDEVNSVTQSMLYTNGNVIPLWRNRDGSLQGGAFGLLLARSIMRRYFNPKKRIDGGFGFTPLDYIRTINLQAYPGVRWHMLSGDMDIKDSSFQGTLYELSGDTLPAGGFDYGPGSLLKE